MFFILLVFLLFTLFFKGVPQQQGQGGRNKDEMYEGRKIAADWNDLSLRWCFSKAKHIFKTTQELLLDKSPHLLKNCMMPIC